MKLIIYLPALNEEKNIQNVLTKLPKTIKDVHIINHLVVDDGSIDDTAQIAARIGAQVLSHGRNRGVGAVFHSAVKFALENGADILVGIDADGQFDPEDISCPNSTNY